MVVFPPILSTFNPLIFSFSKIQVIPYSYGSIIKGYLSEFVRITPFSIETESEGRPWLFHSALVASSTNSYIGESPWDFGICFFSINDKKSWFIMVSLYLLENGPA